MSSLLEEAIVDARALKEAALKNAENIVLEKYSGEVRKALDTLLEQEEPAAEDDTLSEFTNEVPYAFQNEELDAPEDDEIVEIDFDALKARLEEEDEVVEEEDLNDALEMADDIAGGDPLDQMADRDAQEDAAELGAEPVEPLEEGKDRFIIMKSSRALDDGKAQPSNAYSNPATTKKAGVKAGHVYDSKEAAEKDAKKLGDVNPVGFAVVKLAAEDLDEDIDLSEDFIKGLVEELVVDMIPRPQGWSSVNSANNSVEQANNDAMEAAVQAHLEEQDEEEMQEETAPDVVCDHGLYESQISELTESNRELRALIVEAKDQLTKLNLDNAKLVYQNKALNSASLNERQKAQIVEAVQSANSVEEASMIFETIQNAVGSTPDQRTRPQTLREAVQRPTSLLINSKRNNEATKDPTMGRMLRLAGLNK